MKNSKISASLMLATLCTFALSPTQSYAQLNLEMGASASSTTETTLLENNNEASSSNLVDVELETEATTANNQDSEDNVFKVNGNGIAVITAAEVRSESDLDIYADNISVREESVEQVSFESETNGTWQTEVVYQHNGKLFGLMPVTVKSTTVVRVDEGKQLYVDSSLPWWNFIVSEKNHAEAEIESRIRDNATVMTAVELEANAAVKAQVAEAVVAELNAHTYIQSAIDMR